MSQTARVTSVEALKDFREALITFCKSVSDGLCATQMESRRVLDWLVSEMPGYWARQVRERQEDVAQAQAEMHRIKLAKAQGNTIDDVQQKKALAAAKAALAEAQEKVETVRRWGRLVQRAIEEYEGRVRPLMDIVEGNPPPSVVFLDRALDSLDSYLRVAPPTTAPEEPPPSAAVAAVPATATPIHRGGGSKPN